MIAKHISSILDALDVGLAGLTEDETYTSVDFERPTLLEDMPPTIVHGTVVIDGLSYRIYVEAVNPDAVLFGIEAPRRRPFVIHLGTGLTNQGQGSDWV